MFFFVLDKVQLNVTESAGPRQILRRRKKGFCDSINYLYCHVTDGPDQLHFWKRKKRFELHSGFKYSVTQSVGLCTFRGEEKNAFVTAVKRRKILTRVSL